MAQPDLLTRVRRICAQLPDTEESSRLGGQPHFYVRGKIYCGCGVEDGVWSAGMKVGLELQSLLVTRPGFRVAKYVGRYGWISVDEAALTDDAELERLIRTSYDLITGEGECAPKRASKGAAPARSRSNARMPRNAKGASKTKPAAGAVAPKAKAAKRPRAAAKGTAARSSTRTSARSKRR